MIKSGHKINLERAEKNKEIVEKNELLFKFIASLTLADHMGDVAGDIEYVFKELGFDVNNYWELSDIGNYLGYYHGITTLYGTSLGGEDEDNESDQE